MYIGLGIALGPRWLLRAFQSAIWELMDDLGGTDSDRFTPGVQLSADAQTIYDAAIVDGEGFAPSAADGDVLGLIFQPVSDNGAGGFDANGQVFIVGYELQPCECDGLV